MSTTLSTIEIVGNGSSRDCRRARCLRQRLTKRGEPVQFTLLSPIEENIDVGDAESVKVGHIARRRTNSGNANRSDRCPEAVVALVNLDRQAVDSYIRSIDCDNGLLRTSCRSNSRPRCGRRGTNKLVESLKRDRLVDCDRFVIDAVLNDRSSAGIYQTDTLIYSQSARLIS